MLADSFIYELTYIGHSVLWSESHSKMGP